MNLMLAVNDKYCDFAKVMLASFLQNNSFEHNDIYFLYGSVSAENLDAISTLVEKNFDASFVPIKINEKDLPPLPLVGRFSIETYYRFLADELLPKSVERVLWLDSDMVVRKSLKEFYYQDFDGKLLAVCKSINKEPQSLLKKMGLPEDTVYFNAGTILFNLSKIREEIKIKDYFDYIENNWDKITWLDQDVLNALYSGKTKINDYNKYNKQLFSTDRFSSKEKREIEEQACIIHYIGGIKPWDYRFENSCRKYFLEYYKVFISEKEYTELNRKHFFYKINRFFHNIKINLRKMAGKLLRLLKLKKSREEK